jgi:hypothetical protein
MKKLIVFLFAYLFLMVQTGCSSAPPIRTKHTDPIMRVAIDPDSVSRGSYVKLERALHLNGAWIVVDRAMGFAAIDKEQLREHQDMGDRFNPADKYAHWAKLFGVGGILIATQQCSGAYVSWGGGYYLRCNESLTLINATTGEVMAVAEDRQDTKNGDSSPDWTHAVEILTDNYPHRMISNDPNQTVEYDESLKNYRKQSQE